MKRNLFQIQFVVVILLVLTISALGIAPAHAAGGPPHMSIANHGGNTITQATLGGALNAAMAPHIAKARSLAGVPVFTGKANLDFTAANVVYSSDPGGVGDVGLPGAAPTGTISGWDLGGLYFQYNVTNDTMYVGIHCGSTANNLTICGDADGDGLPGATSAWLAGTGGTDWANLARTESFALLLDGNNDYTGVCGDLGFEAVVGKPSGNSTWDITDFNTYEFDLAGGETTQPSIGWNNAAYIIPGHAVTYFANPSAAAPDLEFSIANFSTLPGFSFTPGQGFSFRFSLFAGSAADDGIGEDFLPTQCGYSTVIIPGANSLGNRVWFDTDNDGVLNGAEVGVSGVRVELYQDDGGTPGDWDGTDTFIGFTTTDASGYYQFDNLPAGDYVVKLPAVNFSAGNPLNTYWSSGTNIAINGAESDSVGPDPDNDVDNDDNGVTTFSGNAVNYVSAQAVTLGPGASEPTNDNDPAANPQAGEAPNNQSNRTVDFGFYRVELSNQIFNDVNASGAYDGGDTALSGATVDLYASDGTTLLNTTVTGAGGTYLFSGLAAGDYIVKVIPPAEYRSTVDTANPGDTANPNNNIDNNDNGVGTFAGQVSSNIITLTPGNLGAASNNVVSNPTGTTTNPTLDFGFHFLYSLGNRVWFDTDNDGVLNGAEVGVSGVRVELYRDDGGIPGVWDAGDTYVGFTTTDASGYYRFDSLLAGNYVVKIPAVNFAAGNPLNTYWSSGTSIAANGSVSDSIGLDPDNDVDSDDNGYTTFSGSTVNYVSSQAVTLGPGASEPTNDNDPGTNPQAGEAPNNQSNRTVDFGFYRVELSNQIFTDVNTNGAYDAGDTALPGATVDVYASDGTTLLATTITGAGGTYLFSGLAAGDYIVKVTPPAGYTSTVDTANSGDTTDPNNNIDNNDNGVGTSAGQVSSKIITLTPGSLGAATNNVVNNATGATTNPTLDFGFMQGVAIGNLVWFDTGVGAGGIPNDGIQNGTEVGVPGVNLQLYHVGDTPGVTSPIATTTTNATGRYQFDNLAPGNYFVHTQASNFLAGGPLEDYVSSTGNGSNETSDHDADENGIDSATLPISGINSTPFTLTPNSERTGEDQSNYTGTLGDASVNFTADFGFRPACFASITVTNNADSGAGSLRQAIDDVCAGGTIKFDSDHNILLASELVINKNLTITGIGHNVTVSGNHVTRVFNLTGGTITLNQLTIADGYLVDTTYSGISGAGVNVKGATVNVSNSTFSGNTTGWPGGGGIQMEAGTANVSNCTFSGNSAVSGGYGGGIDTFSGTTLNVTNSTFSGNSAASAGGGLSVGGAGDIINSTISGNSSGWAGGGGGINNEAGAITIKNSIITNNSTGNNCWSHYGDPFNGSNNLANDATCGSGFTNSSSILLGTFGNNGGNTQTFPLLPGSWAIDAGDSAICAAAPVSSLDQRGVVRPSACDIGAFESQGFTLTKTGGDNQSTLINTAFSNPLALSVTSSFSEPVNGGQVTLAAPSSGASLAMTSYSLTISGGGVSQSVTANGTTGAYSVTAGATGATSVGFSLRNQIMPVITWSNPADIAYGTPLSATQLNATADVAGTFVYSPVAGTVLTPGTHTLHADFTPDNTTDYTTADKDVSITVTQGAFWALSPCRVFDTRVVGLLTNGTPIPANDSRTYAVSGQCGIPSTAKAIAANVTVVNGTANGELNIIAGNLAPTGTSFIFIPANRARANNGVVQLATNGDGTILVINDSGGAVHVILDVTGYFR